MRVIASILFCCVVAAPTFAQRGALTVPQNIAQLSQRASIIVRGQVIYARVEAHPQLANLTTVVVSIRVTQNFKGNPGTVLTFRQFIWDIRDKYDSAGYRKGQDLLLLLNPVSVYGMTSPVGMDQGRFEISRDVHGTLKAVNGIGNLGLFSKVTRPQIGTGISAGSSNLVVRHRGGPVPLLQIEELIQNFAGAPR
jgi:hypothetical protein